MRPVSIPIDGQFYFYGSGDPPLRTTIAIVAAANASYDQTIIRVEQGRPIIYDPLHRDEKECGSKRLQRLPRDYQSEDQFMTKMKSVYDPQGGIVSALLETVKNLSPGPAWRNVEWPWNKKGEEQDNLQEYRA